MYKLVNLNGSLACIQYQVGNVLYSIPFDPANTDYQAYLKWVDGYEVVGGKLQKTSEGNTPQPADEVTE
jgi:hypothetical protein